MLYLYLNKEITSEYVAMVDRQFSDFCTEDWLSDDIVRVIEKYENVTYLGKCRFDSPIIEASFLRRFGLVTEMKSILVIG